MSLQTVIVISVVPMEIHLVMTQVPALVVAIDILGQNVMDVRQ